MQLWWKLLMDKKKIVKIIVPACIVLVIVGLWAYKNADKGSKATTSPSNNTSSGSVKPENKDDFLLEADSIDLETLTSYGLPIIIDFGADSCDPCRRMAPVLVKMNEEMQGKAIIKFVDVWKNSAAAREFPVELIPTQIFINADGTPYTPSNNITVKNFKTYSYQDTGEHAFTTHQGGLTEDEMREILADMGVTE